MAATMADGNKVDEVVCEKSNLGGELVAEKSNADEVVAEKSNGGEVTAEKISKMITLVSSDGERFEITHEAAALSQTIHHMIEDECVDNGVPLPNVKATILAKVIEYCNKHATAAAATTAEASSDNTTTTSGEQDLKSFDAEFIKVDKDTLFEIILAANFLNIKGLLDLTCQTVADMIKGYTPEKIRETFHIKNDFTPEEEAAVRAENKWAFE